MGATCISRNKSLLPYQPVPIKATRRGPAESRKSKLRGPSAVSAREAAAPLRNRRRSISMLFIEWDYLSLKRLIFLIYQFFTQFLATNKSTLILSTCIELL